MHGQCEFGLADHMSAHVGRKTFVRNKGIPISGRSGRRPCCSPNFVLIRGAWPAFAKAPAGSFLSNLERKLAEREGF
jgi:hypothetical protein